MKGRYEAVSKVCRSSHRHIVRWDNIASVRGSTNHFPRCICLGTENNEFEGTLVAENLPYPAVQRSSTVNDAGFYDNDAGR